MSFSFYFEGSDGKNQEVNIDKPYCPRLKCEDEDYVNELAVALGNSKSTGFLSIAVFVHLTVNVFNFATQLFSAKYIVKFKYFQKVIVFLKSTLAKVRQGFFYAAPKFYSSFSCESDWL